MILIDAAKKICSRIATIFIAAGYFEFCKSVEKFEETDRKDENVEF